MELILPQSIAAAVKPLFDALPLERAMPDLVVGGDPDPGRVALVEMLLRDGALATQPLLRAGVWLYVDDLARSHEISQQHSDPTGSFWHAIMHRREGDFPNSHYWFRRVGNHPAIEKVGPAYDPHKFIDEVEGAFRSGETFEDMIETQRNEWAMLFQWCANLSG